MLSGSNSFMPAKSICAIAGRSCDEHHQHVVLDLEAHVLEEAGGEQRAHRLLRLLLVHGLADLDRQVAEHRAGLGALQALDADVPDDEGLEATARRAAGGRDAARGADARRTLLRMHVSR